jgi:pilus assembly protein CpaB
MNLKTWIPLFFAVGLALIAAKLTHDVIAKKKGGPAPAADVVQVVVARGDIAPGVPLTAENTTIGQIPGKTPPPHTYTSAADLEGRVATQPLVQGQPINEKLLAPKGQGFGLQAMIPEGFRAVTIEVNEFTGLAGMVAPGMNVDVVGTFRDDSSKDTLSRTVVQNLKVIAVGPRMTPASEDQKEMYKSVTLLANPKDAEKVELAAYVGRPRLSLRNGRDQKNAQLKGASLTELATGNSEQQGPGSSLVALLLKAAQARKYSQPVNYVEVPTTQPSKAPATDVDPFVAEPAPVNRRTIEVIRNGVKSTQTFEIPKQKGTLTDWTVNTDTSVITESK